MADKDAPLNVRRIALRFVVHLVGDIHQPLHAGHRKDRGGNEIHVKFQGRKVRLHKLWDTSLIKSELEKGVRHAVLTLESAWVSFPHGQKAAGTFFRSFISCDVSWQSGASDI